MKSAGTNHGSRQLGQAKYLSTGKGCGRGLIIAHPSPRGKGVRDEINLFLMPYRNEIRTFYHELPWMNSVNNPECLWIQE
jgi:hypothetical protein